MIRLTRLFGLAFGDRACLAAGIRLGQTIMTADRAWALLPPDIGVSIALIRHAPQ